MGNAWIFLAGPLGRKSGPNKSVFSGECLKNGGLPDVSPSELKFGSFTVGLGRFKLFGPVMGPEEWDSGKKWVRKNQIFWVI